MTVRGAGGRALKLAVAALLALPFFARPATAQEARDPTAGVRGATVSEIANNPDGFYGETVTVTGDVEDTLGPRSFTIEDDDLLFDEEVLVVTARPMLDGERRPIEPAAIADDNVRVTGTVHQFNLAAFEDQLGVDLSDPQFTEWAGKPAIIARSLVLDPPLLVPPAATVDAITDDPSAFYGRTVTVSAEVSRVLGARTFTVDDNDLLADEELLVVAALPLPATDDRPANGRLREDVDVRVTGLVRPFDPAEIERDIGFDLNDGLLDGWAGRPAIVVRSIQAPVR